MTEQQYGLVPATQRFIRSARPYDASTSGKPQLLGDVKDIHHGVSHAAGARLGWRASRRAVRHITVRRSIAAPLASLACVTRVRARVIHASPARHSRVPSRLVVWSRRGRGVAAAGVSHAAGARLGLRASRCAVLRITVRRPIAAPLASLARVSLARARVTSASPPRHSRVPSRLVTWSRRGRGVAAAGVSHAADARPGMTEVWIQPLSTFFCGTVVRWLTCWVRSHGSCGMMEHAAPPGAGERAPCLEREQHPTPAPDSPAHAPAARRQPTGG